MRGGVCNMQHVHDDIPPLFRTGDVGMRKIRLHRELFRALVQYATAIRRTKTMFFLVEEYQSFDYY